MGRSRQDRQKPAPRVWLIVIGITVALVSTGYWLLRPLLRPRRQPVTLTMVFIASADTEAALRSQLSRFMSLNPLITVIARNMDPIDPSQADVMAAAIHHFPLPTTEGATKAAKKTADPSPIPWSGPVWSLAARRDALDRAAGELPAEIDALRSGKASPDDFRRMLLWFSQQGISPITLGNSHRWPYLLWLQHWTAATAGPETVARLPALQAGDASRKPVISQSLQSAIDELAGWRAAGYFNPSVWNEGWARGLIPLSQGLSVFALVSSDYLSPIPAHSRAELEFLPFPRGSTDQPWTIGSATYLGQLPQTEAPEEAALLVRYLSSPGVTQALTQATGRPYFAWDPQTGKLPEVIPSWLEAAATEAFQKLSQAALGVALGAD